MQRTGESLDVHVDIEGCKRRRRPNTSLLALQLTRGTYRILLESDCVQRIKRNKMLAVPVRYSLLYFHLLSHMAVQHHHRNLYYHQFHHLSLVQSFILN